jgi:segregation and condensation protein B
MNDADEGSRPESDGASPEAPVERPAEKARKPRIPPEETQRLVEALLFSSDRPLGGGKIASIIGKGVRGGDVRGAVERLNTGYAEEGRAFEIADVAGGYQMVTRPEFFPLIQKLRTDEKSARLSEAALDTLAVIAYRQPILKADINHIRGVESGPLLRTLIEKNLVRIAGRADQPGRPILYGTTKKFMEVFGLKSLSDLPKPEALG